MSEEDPGKSTASNCPICYKSFPAAAIETHVNRCIFLNSEAAQDAAAPTTTASSQSTSATSKRRNASLFGALRSPVDTKRPKLSSANNKKSSSFVDLTEPTTSAAAAAAESSSWTSKTAVVTKTKDDTVEKSVPLAEKMRPDSIDDYVGQTHIFGPDTILRKVLDRNEVPSMILWGPPGCGKVSRSDMYLLFLLLE